MPLLHPKDEAEWLALRAQDVTSTEVAALFGLSKYATPFELWHRKAGNYVVPFEDNERMKWGRRLQDPIAYGIAEDFGVYVAPLKAYGRHDRTPRMGSSFDFEIVGVDHSRSDYRGQLADLFKEHGRGVLEIKNVDLRVYLAEWSEDEDGRPIAPAHIEIQLQHQLEVLGYDWGVIVALVAGNTPIVIARVRDVAVGSRLCTAVMEFWTSVDRGQEPAPDFKADAGVIAKLYGYARPESLYDGTGHAHLNALARQQHALGQQIKALDEDRQALKAEMLTIIGDAEKVLLADGYSITAGMVGPCQMNYVREGYRNFRINKRAAKKGAK